MRYEFDFEKLDVYKEGLEFVKLIFKITMRFPKYLQFSLGDQLRRASLSIVNNIAEGSGQNSEKEKAHFYNYGLNSVRECIPMITLSKELGILKREEAEKLREKL